jgi:hypothetical protein
MASLSQFQNNQVFNTKVDFTGYFTATRDNKLCTVSIKKVDYVIISPQKEALLKLSQFYSLGWEETNILPIRNGKRFIRECMKISRVAFDPVVTDNGLVSFSEVIPTLPQPAGIN